MGDEGAIDTIELVSKTGVLATKWGGGRKGLWVLRPMVLTRNDAKAQLGQALLKALKTAPLSKVTVAGLTGEAGLSRQAFYYHFQDVYDLAAWVFEVEVANHILSHASYDQWAEGYEQLLTYLRDHKDEAYAVIDSLDPHGLERFMFAQFQVMMREVLCEVRGDLQVSDNACADVVDHFASVALGYMVRWLAEGMKEDPKVLVPKLERLLRGQVKASLQALATQDGF